MILKTIELKGLYGSAKIFTDNVEEGAKSPLIKNYDLNIQDLVYQLLE